MEQTVLILESIRIIQGLLALGLLVQQEDTLPQVEDRITLDLLALQSTVEYVTSLSLFIRSFRILTDDSHTIPPQRIDLTHL